MEHESVVRVFEEENSGLCNKTGVGLMVLVIDW